MTRKVFDMYLAVVASAEPQHMRRIEVRDDSARLYAGAENAWMNKGQLRWKNGECQWKYKDALRPVFCGFEAIEQFEIEAGQSFLNGKISDL